jgi:predicted nucleic acid-binding protein
VTRRTAGVRFADTNVLLYAISRSREERRKAEIALRLLASDDLVLSVQVLQEFYVQATRTTRVDRLSHEQATLLIESWLRFPVQDTTVPLVQAALQTADRFRVSYWDAAIVEAARAQGCRLVLSEDLADGQGFDGVTIENPFRVRAAPSRSAGRR